VAQALDLDLTFNGHPLFEAGGLELRAGPPAASILRGPRVGVPYAHLDHREAPLRFALADSEWVTHRKGLAPG
jgi:DNA-3-methyladenine glycosylase